MFNKDFYPTPPEIIAYMLNNVAIKNKICFEPSAGNGNIVDYLNQHGARKIYTCEIEPEFAKLLSTKSTFLKADFLKVTAEEISAVDLIVMNPPFSADEKHIQHAFEIMPQGCQLIALCNWQTLNNTYTSYRKTLKSIIERFGYSENLGSVFKNAQRITNVDIGLINITKPKGNTEDEFEGYFDLTDDADYSPNEGVIRYDEIQDCVSRYVGAVKLYDSALSTGVQMDKLISKFSNYLKYDTNLVFTLKIGEREKKREDFKIELQKAAWKYIFSLMKMEKYLTTQTKADINSFIEKQQKIPFTVRNIYKMLEILVGTRSSRMDKAIIEVFDKFTQYDKENQYQLKGWKTNSNYLLNRKMIIPSVFKKGWQGEVSTNWSGNLDKLTDFTKVLCFLTGIDYDQIGSLDDRVTQTPYVKNTETFVSPKTGYLVEFTAARTKHDLLNQSSYGYKKELLAFNTVYQWGFFEFRAFQKGTIHLTFIDPNVWAIFNREVARIKGYVIPSEFRESYQPKNYTQAEREKAKTEKKTTYQSKQGSKANPTNLKIEVDILHNTRNKSIELKFKTAPDESIKDFLESEDFNYMASRQLWYSYYTANKFQTIKQYFSKSGLSGIPQIKPYKNQLMRLKRKM
ncbi:DUF4942 domain-containing protein [Emticicia sp. 17c]|uniref:DUF4942 domain-containing protein n=1 Tax=Emticicia sp. 17c TaxID=3127704 RepID=UPI00301E1D05